MKGDNQSHRLRNAIIGVAVTAVGGIIALWGYDISLEGLSWVWEQILWIGTALISKYPVPGWGLLTVGLVLVGLLHVCMKLIPLEKLPFEDYTEDIVEGLKWRWKWTDGNVSNLSCFCQTCDATLIYVPRHSDVVLLCEKCPPNGKESGIRVKGRIITTEEDTEYLEGRVEREIYRRIRTGDYMHHERYLQEWRGRRLGSFILYCICMTAVMLVIAAVVASQSGK